MLCLAPNWLGDAVLARGALARLGRSGVQVEVWARPRVARVLGDLPGTSVVATMPHSRWQRFAQALRRRSARDAAALVLPPSWSGAAVAALTGAPIRVGWQGGGRGPLLTHATTEPRRDVHLADQYDALACTLLEALGLPVDGDAAPPPLRATTEECAAAETVLAAAGLRGAYLVVAPGARYGPAKRWPAERFAAAGRALSARWSCDAVLIGEGQDAEAIAAVRALWPSAIDLGGRTDAGALIGILAGARAVLSNDSGAMHLAAALDRPVAGVFGSTTPAWTAPRGRAAVSIVEPVWCAPCFAPTCRQDFACMLGIESDRVVTRLVEAAGAATDAAC